MRLTESISLRIELIPVLEQHDLKLLDINQTWHKRKKSTIVKVAGYSQSNKRFIIKDFLIMSFDAKVIAKVIDNNWY